MNYNIEEMDDQQQCIDFPQPIFTLSNSPNMYYIFTTSNNQEKLGVTLANASTNPIRSNQVSHESTTLCALNLSIIKIYTVVPDSSGHAFC